MTTWLYADPHFFHASMLKFCPETRPYASVEEMNDAMAASFRKIVKSGDDVICLGDFAHRAESKALRRLFDSLPGRKHLIIGNHDGPETQALPWESVRDVAYVTIDSTYCVLAHYPWRSWPRMKRGALMLYGHHHGRLRGDNQSCDVGVDVFGPAPTRLNQIKAYMATLPPRVDPEHGDDFENKGVRP